MKFVTRIGSYSILMSLALSVCACSTNTSLRQFYEAEMPGLAQTRPPAKYVRIVDSEWKYEKGIKTTQALSSQGYWYLGTLEFVGPMQQAKDISDFAVSVGGDLVVRKSLFLGMKQGSQMVVGSYTPGRVVTSTQSAYASGYSTGSGNLYTPYGTSRYTSQGTANAYGSGSSTTYIPGQTTYVRENYEYPAYAQRYSIMQSEATFRKNAPNFRKYLEATKGVNFSDQEYAAFIEQMIATGKARKFSEKPE